MKRRKMMATQATTPRSGTKRTAAKGTTAKGNSAKGNSGATKNRATKKRSTKMTRGAAHRSSHGKRKWSAGVDTESTYPQEGLFKKDAETIARSLASKKVSPKGPSSGMRMLTFYVNRAGKNLPQSRLRVLERAKELLHERVEKARGSAKK
jgi:tRNA(adenine34) deaminase